MCIRDSPQGVGLVEADTLYGRLLVQQPGNGHHAGVALPAQPPEPDGSHLLGRSVAHGLYHKQGIFYHLKLYADALEIALQRLVHLLHFYGVVVGGVRVELCQHRDDGFFHQLVFIHLVHIKVDDGSTDDIDEIIKSYQNEDRILIRFIKQENGGKHRAIPLF